MKKRINNKGFTLVELLATIVILAIISSVTIITVVKYFQSSKEKAEEAFFKQLENYVEDYISLYSYKLDFSTTGEPKQKCYTENNNQVCNEVTLFSASNNPEIETIANVVVSNDLINPATEVSCTNENVQLSIYRDTDFVYCFKLEKNSAESCINETINTCDGIYK